MIKKISYKILFALIIFVVVVYFFSPATTNKQGELQIAQTITIADSVPNVFEYMGSSENAKIWSVYVDHINLLSGEDGKVNCKRRCFKEADENGIQWDEEILEIIPNEKRVLSIYNGKNFPIYSKNLITEQQYKETKGGSELTLILTLKGKQSFLENLKFKFASFVVKKVFQGNLTNIKNDIEKH